MANTLPTTMEYFDNLLGEQLTDGGGGGGGCTTAKVKVIGKANTTFWGSGELHIKGKPIYGILEYGDHFYAVHDFNNAEVGDTTYNVIIFETGEEFPAFQFDVEDGENVTASGNCTVVNPSTGVYAVLFTGDCTITIS